MKKILDYILDTTRTFLGITWISALSAGIVIPLADLTKENIIDTLSNRRTQKTEIQYPKAVNPQLKNIRNHKKIIPSDSLLLNKDNLTSNYLRIYDFYYTKQEISLNKSEYDQRTKIYPGYESNENIKKAVKDSILMRKILGNLEIPSKNKKEDVQKIINFVNKSFYDIRDNKIEPYAKTPLETLVERGGDCEDFAILAYSLMYNVGLDVQLIKLEDTIHNCGHECLAINGNFKGEYFIRDNKKYFFAEPRRKIGEDLFMDLSKCKITAYAHKEKGVFEVKEIYKTE